MAYDVQDCILGVGSVARKTLRVLGCTVVNAGKTSREAILAIKNLFVQECTKWALSTKVITPVEVSSTVAGE